MTMAPEELLIVMAVRISLITSLIAMAAGALGGAAVVLHDYGLAVFAFVIAASVVVLDYLLKR